MSAALLLWACGGGGYGGSSGGPMGGTGFSARALVTDAAASGYSSVYSDPGLINGWGVVLEPGGSFGVAAAGSAKAVFYDANGLQQAAAVSMPAAAGVPAMPTGVVLNADANAFAVSAGAASAASRLVFATLAGTLAGWSPTVDATHALTRVDHGAAGSVYTGLALAQAGAASTLYAADFAKARIEVFDAGFAAVPLGVGAFVDPGLPAGYAPYGIQAVGNRVYVAYAKVDPATHHAQPGAGLGLLDVFDTAGAFVKRLVDAGGPLNAPWGIAMAPAGFGPFAGALLVGNFGDGRLHAFEANSGAMLGTVSDAVGSPIAIDGLWGLAFGSGATAATLFFAAGPANETHGVFGRIDPN